MMTDYIEMNYFWKGVLLCATQIMHAIAGERMLSRADSSRLSAFEILVYMDVPKGGSTVCLEITVILKSTCEFYRASLSTSVIRVKQAVSITEEYPMRKLTRSFVRLVSICWFASPVVPQVTVITIPSHWKARNHTTARLRSS